MKRSSLSLHIWLHRNSITKIQRHMNSPWTMFFIWFVYMVSAHNWNGAAHHFRRTVFPVRNNQNTYFIEYENEINIYYNSDVFSQFYKTNILFKRFSLWNIFQVEGRRMKSSSIEIMSDFSLVVLISIIIWINYDVWNCSNYPNSLSLTWEFESNQPQTNPIILYQL